MRMGIVNLVTIAQKEPSNVSTKNSIITLWDCAEIAIREFGLFKKEIKSVFLT